MKTATVNMMNLVFSGTYEVMDDLELTEATYSNLTISGARLSNTTFRECTFSNCVFYASEVLSSQFINCKFENCKFEFSALRDNHFIATSFTNCKVAMGRNNGNHFSICELDTDSCDLMDIGDHSLVGCFTQTLNIDVEKLCMEVNTDTV